MGRIVGPIIAGTVQISGADTEQLEEAVEVALDHFGYKIPAQWANDRTNQFHGTVEVSQNFEAQRTLGAQDTMVATVELTFRIVGQGLQ